MKIYKEILGNIKTLENASLHVEKLFLSSEDLLKKTIVAKTDHGNEVGLAIPNLKEVLEDGAVIDQDEHNVIALFKTSTDVLIIKPVDMKEMGIIAHNLGNRHSPAQFTETEMLVPYDYLIEEYLVSVHVNYERKAIKLEKAFRHVDGAK